MTLAILHAAPLIVFGNPAFHCFQAMWFWVGMTTPPWQGWHNTHVGSVKCDPETLARTVGKGKHLFL